MAEATLPVTRRRGSLSVWGPRSALALVLGALGAFAVAAPEAAVLIPLGLVVVGALALGGAYPDLYLPAAVVGAAAILSSEDGLQTSEVLYFLYLLAFLAVWYIRWFLGGEPKLRSTQDILTAGVLVLGGGGGIVLGVLYGAPPIGIRNDLVGFFPLLLYFPIRNAVASSSRRTHQVATALLALSLTTGVLALWTLYSTVASATAAWEIIDIRITGYEIPLLIGSIGALAAVPFEERAWKRTSALSLGFVLLAFLIITKSRGYWIGWAFSTGLLFLLLPPAKRWLLARWGIVGIASGVLVLLLTAGDIAIAFAMGIADRFTTLASAFSSDISMLNRYTETDALLERIAQNPILGHGFGTEYSYHDITINGERTYAYAHNGFIGLWFKLGAWGFGFVMVWWLQAAWHGFVASRSRTLSPTEQGYGLGSTAALLGVLLTTYTSGLYFIDAQILVITVTVALSSGLYQRSRGSLQHE